MNPRNVLSSAVLLTTLLTGCEHHTAPTPANSDAAAQTRQQAKEQAQTISKKVDAARQELEEIPPPAKSRYMTIRTQESWSNPFIVVGPKNLTLRVISPDQTGNPALPSSMLKPSRARRQELVIRPGDLPEALGALPSEDWPYGRVVAVEEDPAETRENRVPVRSNVETTVQMLNNLGVVIYEWPANGLSR